MVGFLLKTTLLMYHGYFKNLYQRQLVLCFIVILNFLSSITCPMYNIILNFVSATTYYVFNKKNEFLAMKNISVYSNYFKI